MLQEWFPPFRGCLRGRCRGDGAALRTTLAAEKWIHGLTAATPVVEAAQRVLGARLRVVRDYLPRAIHEADPDTENVHQLRVATRRARAALDIFEDTIPSRAYKKARKYLRTVRRAAGEARDWDVFLAGLLARERTPRARQRPGLDFLGGYAVARRAAAQAHLENMEQERSAAFEELVEDPAAVVHKIAGSHPRTLLGLARPLLAGLLQELERAASGDPADYANLHQVRIRGKRLRYAMEVFAGCFAPPFREELYPAVEQMQEILGRANDSHVAVGHLAAVRDRIRSTLPGDWTRFRPGIEAQLRYHKSRLGRERRQFLTWWKRWQESGGRALFETLLDVPDGRGSESAVGASRAPGLNPCGGGFPRGLRLES